MITTHVLDTSRGGPAVGMTVIFRCATQASGAGSDAARPTAKDAWSRDRRAPILPGTYRLTFDTGAYHRDQGIATPFFPEVKIMFNVRDTDQLYHVPLLLRRVLDISGAKCVMTADLPQRTQR